MGSLKVAILAFVSERVLHYIHAKVPGNEVDFEEMAKNGAFLLFYDQRRSFPGS